MSPLIPMLIPTDAEIFNILKLSVLPRDGFKADNYFCFINDDFEVGSTLMTYFRFYIYPGVYSPTSLDILEFSVINLSKSDESLFLKNNYGSLIS